MSYNYHFPMNALIESAFASHILHFNILKELVGVPPDYKKDQILQSIITLTELKRQLIIDEDAFRNTMEQQLRNDLEQATLQANNLKAKAELPENKESADTLNAQARSLLLTEREKRHVINHCIRVMIQPHIVRADLFIENFKQLLTIV